MNNSLIQRAIKKHEAIRLCEHGTDIHVCGKPLYAVPYGFQYVCTDAKALVANMLDEEGLEYFFVFPSWWTPENQVAEKGWVPHEQDQPSYYPLCNAIFHGCAPSTITRVTINLETGEEVECERQKFV